MNPSFRIGAFRLECTMDLSSYLCPLFSNPHSTIICMYCLCGAMCVYFLYRHSFWWTAATKMKLPSVSIRCHILLLGGVLGWSPNVPPHATLGHLTGLEGVRVRITNIHLSLYFAHFFLFCLLACSFFLCGIASLHVRPALRLLIGWLMMLDVCISVDCMLVT